MILTKILHQSSFTRYSTNHEGVEYTSASSYELDLLKSLKSRLVLNFKQEGFTHKPFKELPYQILIRISLPENTKKLFDTDLKHPIIEFEYKGHAVDMQILQSVGILRHDHAYEIFNMCNDIAYKVLEDVKVSTIRPILGLTDTDEVALYMIPEVTLV